MLQSVWPRRGLNTIRVAIDVSASDSLADSKPPRQAPVDGMGNDTAVELWPGAYKKRSAFGSQGNAIHTILSQKPKSNQGIDNCSKAALGGTGLFPELFH